MADEISEAQPVKKENHFLRLYCAVILMFICYTHYYPNIIISGIDLNRLIMGMGRFAIPIFFLISGYYTFSKDGHSEKNLGKKTLHILLLVIILKLLYLVLDIIYYSFGVITLDYLITAFVTAEPTTMHAWFVYSLLLVYVFWLILYKKNIDFKWTWPLAIIVLVVDLLLTEILPLCYIDTVELGTFAYVFIAIPFFTIGYYIHKYHDRIKEAISWQWLTLMMVVCIVISYFETVYLFGCGQNECNLSIATTIVALTSFLLTFLLKEDQLRCRPLEWMGKNLMPWMYVIFPAGIFFLQNIVLVSYKNDFFIWDICGPFLAIILQCVLALLMWYALGKLLGMKKTKSKA